MKRRETWGGRQRFALPHSRREHTLTFLLLCYGTVPFSLSRNYICTTSALFVFPTRNFCCNPTVCTYPENMADRHANRGSAEFEMQLLSQPTPNNKELPKIPRGEHSARHRKNCQFSIASVGRSFVSPWPRCRLLLCLLYFGIAMARRFPPGRSVVWESHSMPSFRLCRPSFVVAFQCPWRKVSANYAGHGTRVQDLYVTSAFMILQVEDPWEVFGYLSDYASCICLRFTVY